MKKEFLISCLILCLIASSGCDFYTKAIAEGAARGFAEAFKVPMEASTMVAVFSMAYRQETGKWPKSMEELGTFNELKGAFPDKNWTQLNEVIHFRELPDDKLEIAFVPDPNKPAETMMKLTIWPPLPQDVNSANIMPDLTNCR